MLTLYKKHLSRAAIIGLLSCVGPGLLTAPIPPAQASRHRSDLPEKALPAPVWPYPDSLDALVAAPRFHRVLFENDRVRVLEVTVPPHAREPLHTHRWPSVMYRELSCPPRYFDATGTVLHESPKPYQQGPTKARARWQEPEAPHAVENMGDVADRFIRVEYKQ